MIKLFHRKSPAARGVFLFVIFLASILFGIIVGDQYYLKEKIPPGHYAGKIYIGGMTREKAIAAIGTLEADEITAYPIAFILENGNKIIRYEFKPSQIGASLLAKETIDSVISSSGKEYYFEKLYIRFGPKKKIISPCLQITSKDRLNSLINQVSSFVNSDMKNAKFIAVPSKLANGYAVIIKNEIIGRKVNIKDSALKLEQYINSGNFECPLSLTKEYPEVTSQMLKEIPNPAVIGSYTTYYGTHDSPNRIYNIYLVSSFVDNKYLRQDETFSLLAHIGKFNKERGFKEAYVIMGNELVPEYGGGACQIATTLYNSVMMADLKILQRQNHGIYFSIYPLGRDATVYPPYVDFRFSNNTGHPLLIEARPFKKGLTFRIYGTLTGKKISFTVPRIAYRYSTITTHEEDAGNPIVKRIRTGGFSTNVTKIVKKDGIVINKGEIRSFYKLHGDRQKVKIRRKEPR